MSEEEPPPYAAPPTTGAPGSDFMASFQATLGAMQTHIAERQTELSRVEDALKAKKRECDAEIQALKDHLQLELQRVQASHDEALQAATEANQSALAQLQQELATEREQLEQEHAAAKQALQQEQVSTQEAVRQRVAELLQEQSTKREQLEQEHAAVQEAVRQRVAEQEKTLAALHEEEAALRKRLDAARDVTVNAKKRITVVASGCELYATLSRLLSERLATSALAHLVRETIDAGEDTVYIDTDPAILQHILRWSRTALIDWSLPQSVLDELQFEANEWRIPALAAELNENSVWAPQLTRDAFLRQYIATTSMNLAGMNLAQYHLSKFDLTDSKLSRCCLKNVDLQRCVLKTSDLSGSDLSGANLSGADLTNANLSGADLSGANLTGADVTGVDLTSATGANLSGARLSGANIYRATFTRADLSHANFQAIKDFPRTDCFQNAKFHETTFPKDQEPYFRGTPGIKFV